MAPAAPQITPRVNQVTRQIITAAMKVHTRLGPGLLESAYEGCLLHELRKQGLKVESQVALPVVFDGEKIDLGYRIDLIVADQVIVEIKCVEAINPGAQISASVLHAIEWQAGRAADQFSCRASAGRDSTHGGRLRVARTEPENLYHRGHGGTRNATEVERGELS